MLKSKTTLIPLDLSHQVLGTKAVRQTQLYGADSISRPSSDLAKQTPSALRALFTQIMSFFASTYAEVFSITEGPPLHDPLAVSAAIYPEIFDDRGGERFNVDIVTDGVHSLVQSDVGELGRTKVTKLPIGEGGCRIPRAVALDKFWESIEHALQKAEASSPMPQIPREKLEKDGVFNGID